MASSDLDTQNLARICNETLILSSLQKGKKHGYQLALDIEERSEGFFRFNHGTLYPILHKLEKGGLIRGSWMKEKSKRKRRLYSLTASGRRQLRGQWGVWLDFFKVFTRMVEEVEK